MKNLMKEAIRKGLFDPEWYQNQYNFSFVSAQEAFDDCMRKSSFSEVSPSPSFDSFFYYISSLDVYEAGIPPLEHYIQHGQHEGRPYHPLRSTWTPKSEIVCKTKQDVRNGKYAIVLHIFYKDFVVKFSDALEGIDFECDIFVTTPEDEIGRLAKRAFSRNKSVKKVITAISPNKGRNFGPFLVEFSQALLKYDFFCHLHSKKSLYSGKEQTQWANYQVEFLLRDKQVLARTLNAFEESLTYGIYYPTNFPFMPSWVNHWLKNKHQGRTYLKQLGIDDHDEFFPYPVGGMFWARTAALRPLLEKKWTYDDFPIEPIPADGTFLHVLERVIPKIVENQGYRQFFYYPYSGQHTEDKSYIYKSHIGLEQHIRHATAQAEIVSFDIFDTLVKRDYYEPDYAKYLLPDRLGLSMSGEDFVKTRNQVEADLRIRKRFVGDVDLNEVYRELVKRLGLSFEPDELAELEFQIDLDGLHAKEVMVDLLNSLAEQGKTIYIISDTYYLEHQIRKLLEKAGITCRYELYVSSALQLRKDNGSMWDMIKEDLSSTGSLEKFIHIGDNVCSDAQNPGDRGLRSIHILAPLDKWDALGMPKIKDEFSVDNIKSVLKWGPLISQIGNNPFI